MAWKKSESRGKRKTKVETRIVSCSEAMCRGNEEDDDKYHLSRASGL